MISMQTYWALNRHVRNAVHTTMENHPVEISGTAISRSYFSAQKDGGVWSAMPSWAGTAERDHVTSGTVIDATHSTAILVSSHLSNTTTPTPLHKKFLTLKSKRDSQCHGSTLRFAPQLAYLRRISLIMCSRLVATPHYLRLLSWAFQWRFCSFSW